MNANLVITRTPYRVSLFGGGSDYNERLLIRPGATISFSIKRYSNIIIRSLAPVFDSKYRIRYFHREEVNFVNEIKHPIVKYCLIRWLNRHQSASTNRLDILHSGDLPAMTGLGTSSSFTVGLVLALEAITGHVSSKSFLADEAIYIEQVLNQEIVGYQDQIASAYGGFNFVEYHAPGVYNVKQAKADAGWLSNFVNCLKLVFTGLTRSSSIAAKELVSKIDKNHLTLDKMVEDAVRCFNIISNCGDTGEIGQMLHENWMRKKSLANCISSLEIDTLYNRLIGAGASGGKLLGAGGGGFLLVYVPREKQEAFAAYTSDIVVLDVEIDWRGARATVLSEDD